MVASNPAAEGIAGTPSLVPVPDPTALTTDLVERGLASERTLVEAKLDILRQRLDGIDKATIIFNETLTRVPTDVDKQVGNLKELHFRVNKRLQEYKASEMAGDFRPFRP